MPHTPGPWQTNGAINYSETIPANVEVSGQDGVKRVALCFYGETNQERIANARLITAAPDLLAALEFLLADYTAIEGERLTASMVPADKARTAIAKAKEG